MEEISYRSLVWLTYRLGATFSFGLPLVLSIWASIKKESSIIRLLSIYWKVSSLIVISMLLLTGNRAIGYLTTFIAPLLIICSIWFWIDINEELRDLSPWKALPFVIKTWRWILSIFSIFYTVIAFNGLSCIKQLSEEACSYWIEAPESLNNVINNIFSFLFGASWTEAISAFTGYLGLIIYLVGILQWLAVRLPKQGRIAGKF